MVSPSKKKRKQSSSGKSKYERGRAVFSDRAIKGFLSLRCQSKDRRCTDSFWAEAKNFFYLLSLNPSTLKQEDIARSQILKEETANGICCSHDGTGLRRCFRGWPLLNGGQHALRGSRRFKCGWNGSRRSGKLPTTRVAGFPNPLAVDLIDRPA